MAGPRARKASRGTAQDRKLATTAAFLEEAIALLLMVGNRATPELAERIDNFLRRIDQNGGSL